MLPDAHPPLLEISGLRTEIRLPSRVIRPVDDVSLQVRPGEMVGLVGESGCGKTMTALSVLGLLPPGGVLAGGSIRLHGTEIAGLPESEMREVRGGQIGMVFQDPLTSLNPTMTVGRQIAEVVRLHGDASRRAALDRAAQVLDLAGLENPRQRMAEYPHQFSGGMRQRVLIAMALACEPNLLIADEPTSSLDATTAKQILELIDDLRQRMSMAVLLVTHDFGIIAGRTDRVAVMYAGRIVESAGTTALFGNPRHPYTEALFRALPEKAAGSGEPLQTIPGMPPDLATLQVGCRFAARCPRAAAQCTLSDPLLHEEEAGHQFACFRPVGPARLGSLALPGGSGGAAPPWEPGGPPNQPRALENGRAELLRVDGLVRNYRVVSGAVVPRRTGTISAVAGVSFSIRLGQTFGLVGESGSGKSTIGRLIAGLDQPQAGVIRFAGQDLMKSSSSRADRTQRREIQLMFQDAFASLDPKLRAGQIVGEPLAIQRIGSKAERRLRVAEMLDQVGLPAAAVDRYPDEFSGGQRQRIALARALILAPKLVIADEPTSALDVSVQAQILNLMRELQRDAGVTYLFISHNLGVVRYLSDQIGVMYLGKLVEVGPANEVCEQPAHPYTRALLDSAPVPDPAAARVLTGVGLRGDPPDPLQPPSGCRFRTRCPAARDICAQREPELTGFSPTGHLAACHFPLRQPFAG